MITPEIIAVVGGGGGVGLTLVMVWLLIRTMPWFLVAIAAVVTARQKDPTVHKRYRRLLREVKPPNPLPRRG